MFTKFISLDVMSFPRYVKKCAAAQSLTEKINFFFHGTGIENGVEKPLVFDTDAEAADIWVSELNVDAFISKCLRDIPLLPRTRALIRLSPRFETAIYRFDYGPSTTVVKKIT